MTPTRNRSRAALWKLSVAATPELENALTEFLSARFQQPATSYTDLKTGAVTVSLYFDKRPPWTASLRAEITNAVAELANSDAQPNPARISLGPVPREDWAESWKRHFKPLEIGPLLLKPSWSRRQARRGQATLVLDPGLSFGTGQHPTTEFCLRQIVYGRPDRTPKSFLDVGTGSGILALAAAKLGYGPVVAFDVDADAVRSARANARANRLSERIQFLQDDVAGLPLRPRRTYSLVCANLTADLLLKHRGPLAAQVEPDGRLVVAGILETEFAPLRRAYESARWRLLATRAQGEWQSGCFRRPSSYPP